MTLDDAPTGADSRVLHVSAPDGAADWAQQLGDLGFLPGEAARVLTRGALGGDPLVVRVGAATYALRRAEARCIHIEPAR